MLQHSRKFLFRIIDDDVVSLFSSVHHRDRSVLFAGKRKVLLLYNLWLRPADVYDARAVLMVTRVSSVWERGPITPAILFDLISRIGSS